MSETNVETDVKPKHHKNMTEEEKKAYRKYYNDRRGHRVRKTMAIHYCDACDIIIKWDHMSKHRKTNKHKLNEELLHCREI